MNILFSLIARAHIYSLSNPFSGILQSTFLSWSIFPTLNRVLSTIKPNYFISGVSPLLGMKSFSFLSPYPKFLYLSDALNSVCGL